MFKSARWRSEKNKIKAVFKLQFYATQVTGDALMISVVPADVGKPTLKLEKAVVHNGSCYWENAAYETVKFNQEPKSGKIHERIYNFVVGTGTSKSGVLGEVSIDFSSYAEATKVSYVSLPLKNSKSGAILHVSIKRVHDYTDQSIIEESEHAKPNPHDRTLKAKFSNVDVDEEGVETNSVDESPLNKTVPHVPTLNGRTESSESDTTLSSSESSLGTNTPQEVETKNINIHENRASALSPLNNSLVTQKPVNDVPVIQDNNQTSQWEWLGSSVVDVSTDGSSSTPTEGLLEASENADVIEKLRSELTTLGRQADMSELELQTLRKQIVKENKRGNDLSREIVNLKEERDRLKEECEKFKASHVAKSKDKLHTGSEDVQDIVEELRQELNYQKEINANLQIQLQKTQESNSELILAVRDLDEMLEQKNEEFMNLTSKSVICGDAVTLKDANSKCDDDDDEQKALDHLVREHSDVKEVHQLEQKIMDITRDKDELEMQMEQLALDYEILKQENHEMHYKLEQSQLQEQLKMQYECSYSTVNELEGQIEELENELKKQSKEFSDSLVTINKLEAHVKSLEEELEIQAQGFETDLEALTLSKVEQEQRAIRAEEELRKTRWQNANTAERLQMEFKRLSLQMTSSFEANEKMASKALAEANEIRLEKRHLELMLEKSSEELQSMREHYEVMLHELSSMKCLKDDKETLVQKLEEDMDALRTQCSKLRSSLCEDELEKERLRKHVLNLKGDLKKKEDSLNSLEEKKKLLEDQITLKENALETSCTAFLEKEKDLQNKIDELEARLEEINQNTERFCKLPSEKLATEDLSVNSETTGQEKSISDEEIALLKEKNTLMEGELKEMQERYSEISLKFAEVEGERQQLVMKLRNRKNAKKNP